MTPVLGPAIDWEQVAHSATKTLTTIAKQDAEALSSASARLILLNDSTVHFRSDMAGGRLAPGQVQAVFFMEHRMSALKWIAAVSVGVNEADTGLFAAVLTRSMRAKTTFG